MFLRFVQFSDEKRPCGAGAVDLIKDGRTGTEHPVSVAGVGSDVEGESARPLSEFASKRRAGGRTGLDPCWAQLGVSRVTMRERKQ